MIGPAVLLAAALAGHAIFWVGAVNRFHGLGLPRKLVDALSGIANLLCALIPLGFAWWLTHGGQLVPASPWSQGIRWPHAYLAVCLAVAIFHLPAWLERRLAASRPAAVLRHDSRSLDVAQRMGRWPIHGFKARLLSHVPGNQLFQLDIDEEQLAVERLPAALDGLSILHLSDFHFSDRIERVYFDHVVELANELQPDLLAVTGDICDVAAGLDWIPSVFGRLQAPAGKFFVLGNHDLRIRDISRLRRTLTEAGLVDLSTGPRTIRLRGAQIVLAGNERPWFPLVEPELETAARGAAPLKILLSHSPDQLGWARGRGFDLMLAGHTHGGQVCLPWVGPIVCPSVHGIRYAGGTYFDHPTLLHVSRGVSSLFPLRLACPAEMTKLVLRTVPAAAK